MTDLVFGAAGIGRHPAGDHHFKSVFGTKAKTPRNTTPADCVDDRVFILQGQIDMARSRSFEAGYLSAHANVGKAPLDGTLDLAGNLADGIGGNVVATRLQQ